MLLRRNFEGSNRPNKRQHATLLALVFTPSGLLALCACFLAWNRAEPWLPHDVLPLLPYAGCFTLATGSIVFGVAELARAGAWHAWLRFGLARAHETDDATNHAHQENQPFPRLANKVDLPQHGRHSDRAKEQKKTADIHHLEPTEVGEHRQATNMVMR